MQTTQRQTMRVFRTAEAALITEMCGILHTNGYEDTNPNDNLYEVKKIILEGSSCTDCMRTLNY